VRPEDMQTPRTAYKVDMYNPGSDLAGETAAALAASSIVFQHTDPEYSKQLLGKAIEVRLGNPYPEDPEHKNLIIEKMMLFNTVLNE
jgi:hypothetical protein